MAIKVLQFCSYYHYYMSMNYYYYKTQHCFFWTELKTRLGLTRNLTRFARKLDAFLLDNLLGCSFWALAVHLAPFLIRMGMQLIISDWLGCQCFLHINIAESSLRRSLALLLLFVFGLVWVQCTHVLFFLPFEACYGLFLNHFHDYPIDILVSRFNYSIPWEAIRE